MTHEKVLIVEDEENERTGLAELVRAWGYDTETASDGVEGLERAESWNPGIVITDLKMPRMNGMELLEHIAAHPQQVAVILLTAQGSVDAAVSAMKVGAFDFIEKPVNPTRLRTLLAPSAIHPHFSLHDCAGSHYKIGPEMRAWRANKAREPRR